MNEWKTCQSFNPSNPQKMFLHKRKIFWQTKSILIEGFDIFFWDNWQILMENA